MSEGFKLITAVLPVESDALGVMDGLRSELGVLAADVHLGRGASHLAPHRTRRRLGGMSEKKVLTAVVRDEQAEEVFAYIYDKAEVGRAHGGVVYQQPLLRSTVYELPDLGSERQRS